MSRSKCCGVCNTLGDSCSRTEIESKQVAGSLCRRLGPPSLSELDWGFHKTSMELKGRVSESAAFPSKNGRTGQYCTGFIGIQCTAMYSGA